MRFTTLVGIPVISADGRRLGRLMDLRCEREPGTHEYSVVSAIIFGRVGWLERLGLRIPKQDVAAWKYVESFDRREIRMSPEFRRPLA